MGEALIASPTSGRIPLGKGMLKYFSIDLSYKNINHGAHAPTQPIYLFKHPHQAHSAFLPALFEKSAKTSTVVFVPNATTGVNTVLRNIAWNLDSKDEIVYFETIYGACLKTIDYICEANHNAVKPRAVTKIYPIEDPNLLSLFRDAIKASRAEGNQPRLAIFDTVSSFSGVRMPFEALTAICKEEGGLEHLAHAALLHVLSVDSVIKAGIKFELLPFMFIIGMVIAAIYAIAGAISPPAGWKRQRQLIVRKRHGRSAVYDWRPSASASWVIIVSQNIRVNLTTRMVGIQVPAASGSIVPRRQRPMGPRKPKDSAKCNMAKQQPLLRSGIRRRPIEEPFRQEYVREELYNDDVEVVSAKDPVGNPYIPQHAATDARKIITPRDVFVQKPISRKPVPQNLPRYEPKHAASDFSKMNLPLGLKSSSFTRPHPLLDAAATELASHQPDDYQRFLEASRMAAASNYNSYVVVSSQTLTPETAAAMQGFMAPRRCMDRS
ncbi:unnamed protein product [Diplocarpon coronariae]|nr:aminotransferase [Diplocarpon mali]